MDSEQNYLRPIAPALASAIERIKNAPTPERESTARDDEDRKEALSRDLAAKELAVQAGGKRYDNHRFTNWKDSTAKQTAVKSMVMEWANTFEERLKYREGLVLYGPVGTGKDHLVFAACRQAIIQHGVLICWRNGRDLMGEVRDRISEDRSERDWIAGLESPHVLVISDPLPVVGPLTAHQADMLYRVVDNRYAAGRITCVTLNAANDQEADERLGVATWDRLCGDAWKIKCEWASHRKPAREIA